MLLVLLYIVENTCQYSFYVEEFKKAVYDIKIGHIVNQLKLFLNFSTKAVMARSNIKYFLEVHNIMKGIALISYKISRCQFRTFK